MPHTFGWYIAEAQILIRTNLGMSIVTSAIKERFDLSWAEADNIADAAWLLLEEHHNDRHPI